MMNLEQNAYAVDANILVITIHRICFRVSGILWPTTSLLAGY